MMFYAEQSNLLTAEQCHAVINSDHVTRLILLQQLHRLGLVDYSPLDDPAFVAAAQEEGGEGVDCRPPSQAATGQDPDKIFLLKRLRELEIFKIELRMLDRFERGVLSRAAALVERDWEMRKRYKAKWMGRVRKRRRRWQAAWREKKKKREEAKEKAMSEANKKEERKKEVLGNQAKAEVKGDDDILGEMLEGKMPVPSEPLRNQAGEEISGSEEVPGPARTIEGARPEVELEVLRIPANPRCVICRYRLLADEVRINLWVKTNKNFKRGMKLVMHEQAGEDWKFEGVLPRHAGRW